MSGSLDFRERTPAFIDEAVQVVGILVIVWFLFGLVFTAIMSSLVLALLLLVAIVAPLGGYFHWVVATVAGLTGAFWVVTATGQTDSLSDSVYGRALAIIVGELGVGVVLTAILLCFRALG